MQQLLLEGQQTRGHIQITVIGQNTQEEEWHVVYSCFIRSISEVRRTSSPYIFINSFCQVHFMHYINSRLSYLLVCFHRANVLSTVYMKAT